MRVVLLTDADSIFCKEYIEYVLLGKYEILVISCNNKQYRQYYRENGIKVLYDSDINYLVRQLEKSICSDDIFHVHYVDIVTLKKFWRIWVKCRKRYLSYWGSDLLRVSCKKILATLPFLYSADAITVINQPMRKKLKSYIYKRNWKHIKCLDFGNSTLDSIDKVSTQMTTDECKRYFGLDTNKIIIFVGYNAVREQQHFEMMQEVAKLSKEFLEKLFFVFHFGYGSKNSAYMVQLKSLLKENNISYKISTQFMDKDGIAILRRSADIFLYGQTTDALSCSVIEYLYAGAIVVKPIWLDYSKLREKGIQYYEYTRFEELPELLTRVIGQGIHKVNRRVEQQQELRNLCSWDKLSLKWRLLYEEN